MDGRTLICISGTWVYHGSTIKNEFPEFLSGRTMDCAAGKRDIAAEQKLKASIVFWVWKKITTISSFIKMRNLVFWREVK